MKEFVISEAKAETAVLVGLITKDQDEAKTKEYLDELEFLADTAGAVIVKRFTQRLNGPSSVTYVGQGKLDEILTFQQLTREQIADVVRLQMNKVKKVLESQGFDINVTDAAIDYLATEGYDPDFGARPVKRAIQCLVLNDLSRKILADEVSREKPITIDAADGQLTFGN